MIFTCRFSFSLLAFLLAVPSLSNPSVLSALFSLTATGLYSSYIIPIFLRVTVSKDSFTAAEFSLGTYLQSLQYSSYLTCLCSIAFYLTPNSNKLYLTLQFFLILPFPMRSHRRSMEYSYGLDVRLLGPLHDHHPVPSRIAPRISGKSELLPYSIERSAAVRVGLLDPLS